MLLFFTVSFIISFFSKTEKSCEMKEEKLKNKIFFTSTIEIIVH